MTGKFIIEHIRNGIVIERFECENRIVTKPHWSGYVTISTLDFQHPVTIINDDSIRATEKP